MATNEVHRDGYWLTVPVPDTKDNGDPVVFGGAAGVVQEIHKPDPEPMPGYIAIPRIPNGNETGQDIDPGLMPADSVFASVAFKGVWAFDIEGAESVTLGDPVYYTEGDTPLSLDSGDVLYGHVTNRGSDGRLHVRLASVATGA